MVDTTVAARLVVDSSFDSAGFPLLDATVKLSPLDYEADMPPGPPGIDGPQGQPRATFVKIGTLANAAARPAGLTATDRGKWWHRLDTNGMDVWTGSTWKHSPDAVGVVGAPGVNNVLTPLPVLRDETYTEAAAKVRGLRAVDQTIEYTVPAGERGGAGPFGVSGAIAAAPDYDPSYAPVHRSMFAFSRNAQRFRPLMPPNGYGPYFFGPDAWVARAEGVAATNTDQLVAATLTVPAMPFDYRPMITGNIRSNSAVVLHNYVRMGDLDGQIVAVCVNPWYDTSYSDGNIRPFFGDPAAQRISPSNGYAIVPAYKSMQFIVTLERQNSSSAGVNYVSADCSMNVWCQPVLQNPTVSQPTT